MAFRDELSKKSFPQNWSQANFPSRSSRLEVLKMPCAADNASASGEKKVRFLSRDNRNFQNELLRSRFFFVKNKGTQAYQPNDE
jgi:hypothetical protein